MFSKNTDKDHVMHPKSNNTEIMINDRADEVIEDLFNYLFLHIKLGQKDQGKVITLSLIVFICCITDIIT